MLLATEAQPASHGAPAALMWWTAHAPEAPPPGLSRAGDRAEINFSGEISAYYEKRSFEKFIKDGHGLRLGRIKMLEYVRMLAKIGHSYAYAKCGPDAFEPALVNLILGGDECAPYFIGGDARGMLPAQPNVLHDIYPMAITVGEGGPRYLSIVVRLFAFWGTPSYVVIVGKQLKDINLPKMQ
jgi:hypothetical protein